MDNNSCLTVQEGRIYIAVNSAFASLGSLANLVTIILIVWTKAYKKHVHRLTLYLAAFSLCFSLAVGLEVVPVDWSGSSNDTLKVREGWNDACAAIGFAAQHVGLSRSLAVLVVCLYVFLLAICQVKLKRRFYEAAGVACVVLLPSLLSWVPFVNHTYGLTGVWCWIGDDCAAPFHDTFASKLRIVGAVVGDVVPITTSVVLIGVVTTVFCWRLRDHSEYRDQHLLALRELLPLACYPLASAVSLFFGMINSAALHTQSRYAGEMVAVCLMQSAALFLPLSFLLHPSVRRSIRIKLSKPSAVRLPHQVAKDGATSTQAPAAGQHPDESTPLVAQQRDKSPSVSSKNVW
eukprot:Em0004g1137a